MYRWIRTSRISSGRYPQAIGWAKEISGFVTKKFKTPEIRVYMNVTGDIAQLQWQIDYPDLATFEKTQAAVLGDQEYWQHIAKANSDGLFIDGTTNDTLLKVL